jgi:hypothetical protein
MFEVWMLSLLIEVFFIGVPVESALQPLGIVFMLILYRCFQFTYCFLQHIWLLLHDRLFPFFLLLNITLHVLLFKDFHNLLVLVFDGMLNFVA